MKVGIVGLGLIGGSLGLDLRLLGHQVLGVSRKDSTCELAVVRGAVDQASSDLGLLATTDVIFICTPLAAMQTTVEQLMPHLAEATVLTDVGSVKGAIVSTLTQLWPNFVGGHPMAGTAETGIAAAQEHLFVDRPYVITPIAHTPPAAIALVSDLVRSLGCRLYQCPPQAHDRAVAWISHLPAITSANLIAACLSEPDREILNLAQHLASSGFRDTSRVGGGNPELGRMMAQYNREEVLRSLHHYRQHLDQFIDWIEQEDWQSLETKLQQTHQVRPQFLSGANP